MSCYSRKEMIEKLIQHLENKAYEQMEEIEVAKIQETKDFWAKKLCNTFALIDKAKESLA